MKRGERKSKIGKRAGLGRGRYRVSREEGIKDGNRESVGGREGERK